MAPATVVSPLVADRSNLLYLTHIFELVGLVRLLGCLPERPPVDHLF